MATSSGIIKKTSLSAFSRPNRGGIIAVDLRDDDLLVGAKTADPGEDIMLGTELGMAIRFSGEQVRSMGRQAMGVRGIRLKDGDRVKDLVIVRDNATVLTVCESGYGKRTAFSEYRRQSRGGKGLINIRCAGRNGDVVAMKSVYETDDLMLITREGMVVRSPVSQISIIGRATKGVRVMKLKSGDKLIAAAPVQIADINGKNGSGEKKEDKKTEKQEAGDHRSKGKPSDG